jgi:enoyl-CoA hydratase/carnithine racemase
MSELIYLERDGAIATVVLNRPERLNALTKAMWQRLGEVIDELSTKDALRCIILRGAGEKAFSPGNDIGEFENERATGKQAQAYGAVMNRTFDSFYHCPIPLVAMIHGVCVGGGLEIAAACDLRICGQSSRFGAPIKQLGLVMGPPEIRVLMGLAGPAVALEILLEGDILDAQTAYQKGLVTRVVADDQVEREAVTAAQRIAEGAPLVARWHKKFIKRFKDPRPLSQAEIDEGYACYDTEDFQTGYRSFLNKVKPEFKGR